MRRAASIMEGHLGGISNDNKAEGNSINTTLLEVFIDDPPLILIRVGFCGQSENVVQGGHREDDTLPLLSSHSRRRLSASPSTTLGSGVPS